jgi:DNA-binding CsgD family transcriptional regulator
MRRRLLIFLLILTFTMLAAIVFPLAAVGALPFGSTEAMLTDRLDTLSAEVNEQYGSASVQAVRLSERLASSIAETMRAEGFSFDDASGRPELLNGLSKELLPVLLAGLDATDASGVFVTLDATVNPDIAGAETSKAGLYIRNTEPNIGGMGAESRYLLRGDSSLAGNGQLYLQSKWDLEFSVKDQPFWIQPLAAREENPDLPLSRLVYWCDTHPLTGIGYQATVCSVPLLDEEGGTLGVCGFEINQMNFSRRYKPEVSAFDRAVFLFAQSEATRMDLGGALFAGNVTVYERLGAQGTLVGEGDGFTAYRTPDGVSFTGLQKTVRLSPDDSPFADEAVSAALVVPEKDYNAYVSDLRLRYGLILFFVIAVGAAASLILSGRFLNPLTKAFRLIQEGKLAGVKTGIAEIDELIGQLYALRDKPLPNDFIQGFTERIDRLTPVETDIFHYYAEGIGEKEIRLGMFITKDALQTHNRRIYEKLGVTGKEALMLYIELIKTSGIEHKVIRRDAPPAPISGGEEEVINRINRELEESAAKLKAANNLLAEEEKVKRALHEEKEKTLLMAQLETEIYGHVIRLNTMIEQLENVTNKQKATVRITLLLCYLKRRCNLFFRERETAAFPAGELTVYMDELGEIAGYAGVKVLLTSEVRVELPIRRATLFYDFFYSVLYWATWQEGSHILARFGLEEEHTVLRLLPSGDAGSFQAEKGLLSAIALEGGGYTVKDLDEDTAGFCLTFPKGGVQDG